MKFLFEKNKFLQDTRLEIPPTPSLFCHFSEKDRILVPNKKCHFMLYNNKILYNIGTRYDQDCKNHEIATILTKVDELRNLDSCEHIWERGVGFAQTPPQVIIMIFNIARQKRIIVVMIRNSKSKVNVQVPQHHHHRAELLRLLLACCRFFYLFYQFYQFLSVITSF